MSGQFVENAVLLLLTALITGLIVPVVLRRIDEGRQEIQSAAQELRLREQKRFEADLARQTKVIDAQGAFLNTIADLLWEYQLLFIAVPYYHQFPQQRGRYLEAVQEYHAKAGECLGRIRAEISKGMRLTTRAMFEELKDLYYRDLFDYDLRLTRLVEKDMAGATENTPEWSLVQRLAVEDLSTAVDDILGRLATALHLSQDLTQSKTPS